MCLYLLRTLYISCKEHMLARDRLRFDICVLAWSKDQQIESTAEWVYSDRQRLTQACSTLPLSWAWHLPCRRELHKKREMEFRLTLNLPDLSNKARQGQSVHATMNRDEAYKRAQEAWVSNCTGGSVAEIISVCSSLVVSIADLAG